VALGMSNLISVFDKLDKFVPERFLIEIHLAELKNGTL
jgi:hypothetical protein